MILRTQTGRDEGASVLMVSLYITALVGAFLFSYLYLVRQQGQMVVRARAWNSAMGMAEAGVEEALAQLNPGAPLPSINRAGNGWGGPVGGVYGPVVRGLPEGSYAVVITTDTVPVIYASGFVAVPSIPAVLVRTIRVGTTSFPLFSAGMVTLNTIDFNGNDFASDSFNSANPNLNTNGRYDPDKASTNGTIASLAGILNVGDATINGSVLLGPGVSSTIENHGVITGGISNDFNASFPEVLLPAAAPSPAVASPQVIDGVSFQYVFSGAGGYYSVSGLNGSLYVSPGAQVTLLVNGSATVSTIEVAGTNTQAGKLTLYMDGSSFTLTGQGIVDGGNPASLSYLGTTNNTAISLSGNASFIGTIYAPEAALTLGGGGVHTYDFSGATVTKSVTMNGQFNFHFDENLLQAGPVQGYVATSWKEL